jgi:hypothetical protein
VVGISSPLDELGNPANVGSSAPCLLLLSTNLTVIPKRAKESKQDNVAILSVTRAGVMIGIGQFEASRHPLSDPSDVHDAARGRGKARQLQTTPDSHRIPGDDCGDLAGKPMYHE